MTASLLRCRVRREMVAIPAPMLCCTTCSDRSLRHAVQRRIIMCPADERAREQQTTGYGGWFVLVLVLAPVYPYAALMNPAGFGGYAHLC